MAKRRGSAKKLNIGDRTAWTIRLEAANIESMKSQVLISVTTFYGDWQQQLKDLKTNGIREFALFLTGLKHEERPALYHELEIMEGVSIPFAHAHSDMTTDELDYLIERFGVQFFNIHSETQFPLTHNISRFNDRILLENSGPPLIEAELVKYAGLCLDLSHLESERLMKDPRYENTLKMLEKYPVKANHISGIAKATRVISKNESTYDRHDLESMDQLEYLERYRDEKFLGRFIAIEMVNDIAAQTKAKDYIESILDN